MSIFKNKAVTITIGALLLFLIAVAFLFKPRKTNAIEFTRAVSITNTTDLTYYDSIIYHGLEELDIENVYIRIKNMTVSTEIEGTDRSLAAFVQASTDGTQFLIDIYPVTRARAISILSHELIHIQQYNSKELLIDEAGVVTYKGIVYLDYTKLNYLDRPWERDAYFKAYRLERRIRDRYYQ